MQRPAPGQHPPELAGLAPGDGRHLGGCLLRHLILLAAPSQALQLNYRVVHLLRQGKEYRTKATHVQHLRRMGQLFVGLSSSR